MQRVLYVSTACCKAGSQDDFDILQEALRFNADHDICGYLLRTPQQFFQVLEGSPRDLDDVLERISRDHRHQDMRVLMRHPISERFFKDWAMGFKILNATHSQALQRKARYSAQEIEALLSKILQVAGASL